MQTLNCYKIEPKQKPKKYRTVDTLESIEKAVGGIPEFIKVKLRTGKQVSIVFDSTPMSIGYVKDYNFTLCVVPDNKRTWFDFCGPVLIMGREGDGLVDLELEEAEIDELISRPYDD